MNFYGDRNRGDSIDCGTVCFGEHYFYVIYTTAKIAFSAHVQADKCKLFHFFDEKMAKYLVVSQKRRYFAPEKFTE